MNSKTIVVIFLISLFVTSCKKEKENKGIQGDDNCLCFDNLDSGRFFATHLKADINQSDTILTAQCVSVKIESVDDGSGGELERNSVECLSKETRTYLLNEVEFKIIDKYGYFMSQEDSKIRFFDLIKEEPDMVYNISLDKEGNISSIASFPVMLPTE